LLRRVLEAERNFRKVAGYRVLPKLVAPRCALTMPQSIANAELITDEEPIT
jgi:hypothetical protein